MKIVVFDFDKTITYKDSFSELFLLSSKVYQKFVYCFLKVLSKFGLISVEREKMLMIRLLFDSDVNCLTKACEEYCDHISFTPILDILKNEVKAGSKVIVLSATSEILLKLVFKDVDVLILGTKFRVNNENKITGIIQHPYDSKKLKILQDYGIESIDRQYFDSHHDECLKKISKSWCRVQNGRIVEIK